MLRANKICIVQTFAVCLYHNYGGSITHLHIGVDMNTVTHTITLANGSQQSFSCYREATRWGMRESRLIGAKSFKSQSSNSRIALTTKVKSGGLDKYNKLMQRKAAEQRADAVVNHKYGNDIINLLMLNKPLGSSDRQLAIDTLAVFNDMGCFPQSHISELVSAAIKGERLMPTDIVSIQSAVKLHFGI